MNLSDIVSGSATVPSTDVARLEILLAQIGAEIAGPLTSAIERINALSSTGCIDGAGLRALRDDVEAARQAGMIGQQLTRFASGRIRQSHEVLQLADVVTHVLAQRQRQTQARGATLRPNLARVEVIADASLLFSLLNATVDWALANAASAIEFTVEARSSASPPRLGCRFEPRSSDDAPTGPLLAGAETLDSLTWRLMEQIAWTMGLQVERRHDDGRTCVAFVFRMSAGSRDALDSALGADDGFAASANSQPLAGSHVLVIASRRDMRMQIRDALRGMSLIVDFVNSVDEATAFCREGLPHAVIVEAIQSGERFAKFRAGIRGEVPDFVFIEVVEEGRTVQMSGTEGGDVARVGRDVLAESLRPVLMFELSKNL